MDMDMPSAAAIITAVAFGLWVANVRGRQAVAIGVVLAVAGAVLVMVLS